MRILIIGAGATGGFFGGRLAQAGRDVTFLVRPTRAAQLRTEGLQIQSPHGNAHLTPTLITAPELQTPYDLILLSTKSYSLPAAMEDFAPAVGPQTLILPILNGMAHLDTLITRFGAEHVLGGSCRIVADLSPEGHILQTTPLGELTFGPLLPAHNPLLPALTELLTIPHVVTISSPDILAALWQKWWILSSLGATCILARGTVGQAAATQDGPTLIRQIIAESITIAQANGYPADPAMLASHTTRMTDPTSELTSSLYRDMTRNQPVEADQVLGDLLARRKQVAAPLLTAAYVQLKVYEATR